MLKAEKYLFSIWGSLLRLWTLRSNLIRLSGYKPDEDIEIKITGLRPGEKLYEEMLMSEEGLTDTANSLIHVGKPLVFDEEAFLKKLEVLYDLAYSESDDIKSIVEEIVPTYREKSEDKIRDKKIKESQFTQIKDREVTHKELVLMNNHNNSNGED